MTILATILAVVDRNRGIGKDGKLLCHLPNDLALFRRITLNHVVIMGRKTWASLPNRYLDDRHNIVISKQSNLGDNRLIVVNSPEFALQKANEIIQLNPKAKSIFVIGGQQIYEQFLKQNLTDLAIITHIRHEFEHDAVFPKLGKNWELKKIAYEVDNCYKIARAVYIKL